MVDSKHYLILLLDTVDSTVLSIQTYVHVYLLCQMYVHMYVVVNNPILGAAGRMQCVAEAKLWLSNCIFPRCPRKWIN